MKIENLKLPNSFIEKIYYVVRCFVLLKVIVILLFVDALVLILTGLMYMVQDSQIKFSYFVSAFVALSLPFFVSFVAFFLLFVIGRFCVVFRAGKESFEFREFSIAVFRDSLEVNQVLFSEIRTCNYLEGWGLQISYIKTGATFPQSIFICECSEALFLEVKTFLSKKSSSIRWRKGFLFTPA